MKVISIRLAKILINISKVKKETIPVFIDIYKIKPQQGSAVVYGKNKYGKLLAVHFGVSAFSKIIGRFRDKPVGGELDEDLKLNDDQQTDKTSLKFYDINEFKPTKSGGVIIQGQGYNEKTPIVLYLSLQAVKKLESLLKKTKTSWSAPHSDLDENNKKVFEDDNINSFDKDEEGSLKGLEGPFKAKNGKIYYYSASEGQYYDRSEDRYLDNEEISDLMSKNLFFEVTPPGREKQVKKLKKELPKTYVDSKTGKREESNPWAIAWASYKKD